MSLKIVLIFLLPLICIGSYLQGMEDSLMHKINWAGPLSPLDIVDDSLARIIMTSAKNEKYSCILPKPHDSSKEVKDTYLGASPFDLIAPLFDKFCTFKLETYWTYELCHGKYIRQYHEEREGKKSKLQEYFLGRWNKEDLSNSKRAIEEMFINEDYKSSLPIRKIDGVNMPALQLNMSDGTLCDLNGEPRNTRVLYVCDPRGKHELASLEEVSTCEYEIIVLTPLLCEHPHFKSKQTTENIITCHSLDNAPDMPKALAESEAESLRVKNENLIQNLENLLVKRIKTQPARPINGFPSDLDLKKTIDKMTPLPSTYDPNFISLFLQGKECLKAGSHWWKFEFCFGKHVLQYHEETVGGSRTEIVLGKWDEEEHLLWSDLNPSKKPSKKVLYHYYSGGADCDQTGEPRSVEIKLRCPSTQEPSSSVSMYLMEPKTCAYTLSVDAPFLCPLISGATPDYGLIDFKALQKSSKNKLKKLKSEEGNILNIEEINNGQLA